ncbi:AlpA family phage regulatory protein [Atlantibacter hermannii]|uniref:helix-turn-helix transcriptional regulator n=1 Tax=Atlantibacter hermannii TaxID=565 RepID=UPI002FFC367A
MKRAIGKKELMHMVPLSMSTIDRLEHKGRFPKRWYITDRRCAWNADEVEQWLDKRKAESPEVYTGKKPPVELRVYRPVITAP